MRASAVRAVPYLYGVFLLAVLCVLLWLLLGDAFLPRGAGFSLLVLYLAASAAGALVKRLSRRLPPLLGMLLAGLVLRNLPGEPLRSDHALLGHAFAWWSNKLRACALATIMLRAGLGLDLAKLRRMGLATARLAFCPCLAEALTVALLAAALLSMPPAWGMHSMLESACLAVPLAACRLPLAACRLPPRSPGMRGFGLGLLYALWRSAAVARALSGSTRCHH